MEMNWQTNGSVRGFLEKNFVRKVGDVEAQEATALGAADMGPMATEEDPLEFTINLPVQATGSRMVSLDHMEKDSGEEVDKII